MAIWPLTSHQVVVARFVMERIIIASGWRCRPGRSLDRWRAQLSHGAHTTRHFRETFHPLNSALPLKHQCSLYLYSTQATPLVFFSTLEAHARQHTYTSGREREMEIERVSERETLSIFLFPLISALLATRPFTASAPAGTARMSVG